jgi:alginate O-acetyltransferase complex protein AlgI
MYFNSLDFAIFFPVVFLLYWFVFNKSLLAQNSLIVIVSYVFYGWWDWRFLTLIFFSTALDYLVGILLLKTNAERKRKLILLLSVVVNLGLLGFFKYFNFFIESFESAFSFFGYAINSNSLNIILPVGISFYTFQTLSYSIDVYRKNLVPTKDFIAFSAFVTFFPQLVAGPIERATNLLPQFYSTRKFNYQESVDGMRQILWGLFKKIVIADNCAEYANIIFNDSADLSGSTLVLGAVFFAFQIYGDFSGYSDIAIGTSRILGFSLMRNFAFPYFARDIAEFWRRWHISLSTWFRDYLYIPLGGSRGSLNIKVRNTFIIFLVSGFWHGANWTFVAWGAIHAFYFMPLLIAGKNRENIEIAAHGKIIPSSKEFLNILLTFTLVCFAWIFFRADSITHVGQYISGIFSASLFSFPTIKPIGFIVLVIFFIMIEWIGRHEQYALAKFGLTWRRSLRWSAYYFIVIFIFYFAGKQQEFIYFQF